MTVQTLDTRAAEESTPIRKAAAVERARFPLVWKLFGLTALLIVVVVAIAVGITIQRADGIARTTVNSSISGAARLFKEFERQRLGRLALPTELLGNDPAFVAYIQKSLAGETPATDEDLAPLGISGQEPSKQDGNAAVIASPRQKKAG